MITLSVICPSSHFHSIKSALFTEQATILQLVLLDFSSYLAFKRAVQCTFSTFDLGHTCVSTPLSLGIRIRGVTPEFRSLSNSRS